MSGFLLIARNDIKRQFVQPFAWVVLALTCALLAWQFLVALDAYLRAIEINAAHVPSRLALGRLYATRGQPVEAGQQTSDNRGA